MCEKNGLNNMKAINRLTVSYGIFLKNIQKQKMKYFKEINNVEKSRNFPYSGFCLVRRVERRRIFI